MRRRIALISSFALGACTFEPPVLESPPESSPIPSSSNGRKPAFSSVGERFPGLEDARAFRPKPGSLDPEFAVRGIARIEGLGAATPEELARSVVTDDGDGVLVALSIGTTSDVDAAIVRLDEIGNLDEAFGQSGVYRYATAADDFIETLEWDGGALLAAGSIVGSPDSASLFLARMDAGGRPDVRFGGDGVVLFDRLQSSCGSGGESFQVAFDLVLDGLGFVYATGNATEADCQDRDMVVLRIDTVTGRLDPSFGTEGVLRHQAVPDATSQSDNGQSVALLPDGRIAVVGNTNRTDDFSSARAVVWGVLPGGQLDLSFARNGFSVMSDVDGRGGGSDSLRAVAVDGSGRIVAAGRSYNGRNLDLIVVRLTPDGHLDPSFGGDGVVVFDGGSGHDYARRVLVDGEDRVLVVGSVQRGASGDIGVWRFLEDGTPDASFGDGGLVALDSGMGEDTALGLALDREGRILVSGGFAKEGGGSSAVVARLLP